jgi:hypothetical protein
MLECAIAALVPVLAADGIEVESPVMSTVRPAEVAVAA